MQDVYYRYRRRLAHGSVIINVVLKMKQHIETNSIILLHTYRIQKEALGCLHWPSLEDSRESSFYVSKAFLFNYPNLSK